MIEVETMNGEKITINAELIESVKATPDTIITLTNKKKLVVTEEVEEIVARVVAYRRKIFSYNEVTER